MLSSSHSSTHSISRPLHTHCLRHNFIELFVPFDVTSSQMLQSTPHTHRVCPRCQFYVFTSPPSQPPTCIELFVPFDFASSHVRQVNTPNFYRVRRPSRFHVLSYSTRATPYTHRVSPPYLFYVTAYYHAKHRTHNELTVAPVESVVAFIKSIFSSTEIIVVSRVYVSAFINLSVVTRARVDASSSYSPSFDFSSKLHRVTRHLSISRHRTVYRVDIRHSTHARIAFACHALSFEVTSPIADHNTATHDQDARFSIQHETKREKRRYVM